MSNAPALGVFDHAVIIVDDVAQAMIAYEKLGFSVAKGGDTGPITNALIPFEDDSYIELLGARSAILRSVARGLGKVGIWRWLGAKAPKSTARFVPLLRLAPGCHDWAIRVDDCKSARDALLAKGLDLLDYEDYDRSLPDGGVVSYRLSGTGQNALTPFMIEDRSKRGRLPQDARRTHANGARGVMALDIGVKSHVERMKAEADFAKYFLEPDGQNGDWPKQFGGVSLSYAVRPQADIALTLSGDRDFEASRAASLGVRLRCVASA